MSIHRMGKTDYSYLFQSISSSKGNSSAVNLNFLSDYASIKNGSYKKLMRAYFDEGRKTNLPDKTDKINNMSLDSGKTIANVQKVTDQLKASADKLLEKGENSVFSEDKVTEKTFEAVSSFLKDYNDTLSSMEKVNSTSILEKTLNMTGVTSSNKNLLNSIGITIEEDNSLKIEKETFMSADISTVKNLLHSTGSFAYQISAQASFINFAADHEGMKANTYGNSGKYNNPYTQGSIFNQFF